MEILGQIIVLIAFFLIIKGISALIDNPEKRPGEPEPSPEIPGETDSRLFQWTFEDNLKLHFLSIEIKIRKEDATSAKSDLISDTHPSKVLFTSEEDYFILAKLQILHDNYGLGSYEIEQITEYLKEYADREMLSNYQYANLILSFVHEQNIKYSYDKDSTGYPEYLRYPIETIYDRTGDCDCKAVLACTLYKKLGYEVAFALMPGHAALAITTQADFSYSNYYYNGKYWYYCEATGNKWKPGELPDNIRTSSISIKEI